MSSVIIQAVLYLLSFPMSTVRRNTLPPESDVRNCYQVIWQFNSYQIGMVGLLLVVYIHHELGVFRNDMTIIVSMIMPFSFKTYPFSALLQHALVLFRFLSILQDYFNPNINRYYLSFQLPHVGIVLQMF